MTTRAKTLTHARAATLAREIRDCQRMARAIAQETNDASRRRGSSHYTTHYPGMVGALQSTLVAFVQDLAGSDAGAMIRAAFDYVPTDAEIADYRAERARIDAEWEAGRPEREARHAARMPD